MALKIKHAENQFGVGDVVRVHQKIQEGDKTRTQVFEGMVIGIKGRDAGKSFTVRRMGAQKVGIEMIFPINSPVIEKIEVTREGTEGVQQAKLYYTRYKSSRQIEKIYSRAAGKNKPVVKKKKAIKKASKKKSK
jgi:large subunit ribosomal protein L19